MSQLNFRNHFLIAMPAMGDWVFSRSLVYICDHNEQGALGVIVNRPTNLVLDELYTQIQAVLSESEIKNMPVHYGGPVQTDRGFVLHAPIGQWQSTLAVNDKIGLTTSKDILQGIGLGKGPSNFLVTLGYAGWTQGQLEQELSQNAWLSVPASDHVLFDLSAEERLPAAMALLGIDYASLSEDAGHA